MKLSEAILIGSTLRREGRSGPFVRVANSDELLSDVWGAACEAVHSLVAKRNWNDGSRSSDIEYVREIQQKYFASYFKMPAVCPGAQPRPFVKAGGRFTGRKVQGLNEFVIEKEKQEMIGGITTACSLVMNLAEFTEHAFYVHNWTREECAQAVEWYEQQSAPLITRHFDHYQDNAVTRRTTERLIAAAVARHQQRQQRKSYFLSQ